MLRRSPRVQSSGRPRPGPRGYRHPGGGYVAYLEPIPEWRGTTVQVCGLYPLGYGSGTPMVGVPVGRELLTGATLCCDPISWFAASIIANPSQIVLGRPGLGKSTLVRRQVLGLAGYGVIPLVLGDLKPDYADLIAALGGQVVKLGRGRGALNVLDPGATAAAAARLSGAARARLLADLTGRQLNMVIALLTVLRRQPVADHERTIVAAALRVLGQHHTSAPPTLGDLIRIIDQGPPEVRAVTLERGSERRYRAAVDPLHASLLGLLDGALGEVFARPTTTPIDLDSPGGVCVDISGIDESDIDLQAAVLLACWSEGFGAIEAAHALADAGLAPQRHFFVVLDELWRVLRAGRGMVDRVDALTRLNRQHGIGQTMITHTMGDLIALPDEADRVKARGFAERAGMVICAGLPEAEMAALTQVVGMSSREQQIITGWSAPPSWDPTLNHEGHPPGLGHFLVKVGGRPGIPFRVELTDIERALGDTNKRWHAETGPFPLTWEGER